MLRTVGVLRGVAVHTEEQQLRLEVLVERLGALQLDHPGGGLRQVGQRRGAVGARLRELTHQT